MKRLYIATDDPHGDAVTLDALATRFGPLVRVGDVALDAAGGTVARAIPEPTLDERLQGIDATLQAMRASTDDLDVVRALAARVAELAVDLELATAQ